MIETKKCSKCGEEKDLIYFRKDRRKKDGLYVWCKKCSSENNVKWQRENREKQRQFLKTYREKNKEKIEASKKKLNEKYKILRKLNPQMFKERDRKARRIKVETLSDDYVKQLLCLKDATPELIELKRNQVLIHRITKQLKQEIKNV